MRLHTDLSKGWGCVSRKRQEVDSSIGRHYNIKSLSSEETLLFYVPLVWKVTLQDLEPADLNDMM